MLQTELPIPASIFPCISFSGGMTYWTLLKLVLEAGGQLRFASLGFWTVLCLQRQRYCLGYTTLKCKVKM